MTLPNEMLMPEKTQMTKTAMRWVLLQTHRELLGLCSLPVISTEQAEVGSLHELVHVLQECHLLLVQLLS